MDRSGVATGQEAIASRHEQAESTVEHGIMVSNALVFSGADEGTIGGQDFRRPAESNAGRKSLRKLLLCFWRRSTVAS